MARLWAIGLLAVLPLAVGFAQTAGDKDIKIEDKLTANDAKDSKTKSPSKVHTVKLKAGNAYLIDMVSKDMDPLLRLEDKDGKELAFDDDGGGFPNARIVFKCSKDDDYKVICTSFPGDSGVGAYSLTVKKATQEDLFKAFPHEFMIAKPAPEIQGEFSLNGKAAKLSDLKGKVVLVDFWAVWCGPCIATFPHLREWSAEYQKDGLEILGVTTYFERYSFDKEAGKLVTNKSDKDDKDPTPIKLAPAEEHAMVKDFASHHKLSHQLMLVTKNSWKQATEDYHFQGIPTAVLVDRQGNVRMVRVGSGPDSATALHDEIKKLLAER